jgi:hypothetical protein
MIDMEKKYEGNKILIPLFFEEMQKVFAFLKRDSGYNIEWGIDTFEHDKLKKVTKEDINNESWYFSVVRFNKKNTTLSFKYGERENIISAIITYEDDEYGLWELVNVLNPNEKRNIGNYWVLNSDFLIRTVEELGNITKDYLEHIEAPLPELIEKVKKERKARQDLYEKKDREKVIERACYKATEEFQRKNYMQVAQILEQYESELPKSALLKLKFAKKHVL